MNLIRVAIERPVAVIAAVLMTVLFGLLALSTIPIQLTPDVNRPVITVTTYWAGGAPAEVEREILNRQEETMAGLEGLERITGNARSGRSQITLEFGAGTNMDRALLLVANRLDGVSGYPDEAGQPTLDTAGSEDNAIAWFVVRRTRSDENGIHEIGDFVEDTVKDRLERVPGVSRVNVFGGATRQVDIRVRPAELARYQLTISDISGALRRANVSVSAGDIDEGKRRYVIRTEGQLDTLDKVRSVVLRSVSDAQSGRVARVMVSDVAEVSFGYTEPGARIRTQGEPAMALNALRETGANVIETMDGIRQAVKELNEAAMPDNGLSLVQVYDETVYINSAINLVRQNIWVGGTLAALVLLLFLRSARATLIVSIAIPVSVVGAFVAMAGLGRSINVISLAGLAFAIGMVVDAAIVVMENIFRLKERGAAPGDAAYQGARQVWGAVLVSALTTVMVFIPILTMRLEVGQLFRDIAVAISVAVVLSLLVSITVIPALSNWLFALGRGAPKASPRPLRIPILDALSGLFVRGIMVFVGFVIKRWLVALSLVAGLTVGAGLLTAALLPNLEYLPEGNRNLVFGLIIPPPGYNLTTMTEIAQGIEQATRPYWLNPGMKDDVQVRPPGAPAIERFFFVATRGPTFLGAIAQEPQRAAELIPILQEPVFREPGTFGFISQPSIFGRGIGGGRKIDLDISGPDLHTILEVAGRTLGKIVAVLPREKGNQLRPNPGLEFGAPEIRIYPHRLRLADNGLSARELGETVDAFNDGLRVAEVTLGNRIVDLVLRGERNSVNETQAIGNLPVVTASGKVVPVSQLGDVEMTAGPTEIRHRERLRTVTLEVRPSQAVSLETALNLIRHRVIDELRGEGLPPLVKLDLSGTVDQMEKTWSVMQRQLVLAVIIVTLVMAVLFESFVYPLVVLLSVPVAAAGGVIGLWLLNQFQPQALDMLTLLGFVILIGIVVNNAILLVHQTLFLVRERNAEVIEAIAAATRDRIRPIFMSTLTSVVGMLPLVLFPGAGSELYRGLGSVVVGGLALSAMITLLIVPPMLAMVVAPLERRRSQRLAGGPA